MRKIYILILLLVGLGIQAAALPPAYRNGRLIDQPALVSGSYTGFCQDNDGFVWIGTNRGLFRFDGNAFDIYLHEDGAPRTLSDSRVLDVLCDAAGRVWVATANGLNLYDPDTDSFKVVKLPSKSFLGYIIDMGEQPDGTVTFIASGVGLYVVGFDGDEPVAVNYTTKTESAAFNSIVCCSNGQMYFGVHEGKVFKMAPNGHITPVQVSNGEYIVALALESDGNVLVATLNELYRLDVKTNVATRLDINGKITIQKLSNTDGRRVYVSTSDHGLWQVPTASGIVEPAGEIYCPFANLRNSSIGAVFSAPDGNLWIGCNYKGVVIVPGTQSPFTYRKFSDDFPDFSGGVNAMALWKDKVLAAIDKGRVVMFAPDGRIELKADLPSGGPITSIVPTGDGKALLGVVGDGVWQLDLLTGSLREYLDIQGTYPLLTLALGRDSELFVGVYGTGLMRHNMITGEQTWIPHKEGTETGFSNPYITSMLPTDDGKLWISTYSGLACYDMEARKMLEVDQMPFLNGTTFTVAPDSKGTVLAGTSHGLIHFDREKGVVKTYTTRDGLSDNDVRSVVADSEGGVWIGTQRGLSYLTPDKTKIFAYYGGYGLIENVFNHVVYSRSADRIYLGNDLGMTSFRPESVPSPGFAGKVKVSAIYLNGNRLDHREQAESDAFIEGNAVSPTAINLPYKNNAMTLRLSMLDYRDASNISYRWRLHGNDDWIQTLPGENLIYLPHLEPGDYDFEVCAVENKTTSEPTRVKIHISTPWYLSFWAKLAYSIVLIALIALAWIVMRKKRDEKINDEKIKFFMDISHDLRSPISLVLSPLESLLKQPFDAEVHSKLEIMHRNVYRMLGLVNQLLDIRKIEKGKMSLKCRQTDMNAFVGELVEMFRPQAEDKKLTISFSPWDSDRQVWLDRKNFDKILVNLISNAIKYTPEGGAIEVAVESVKDDKMGDCVSVSVTDTGIGLDSKTAARLFERFYRVEKDQTHATIGFGIGLDLCRRLSELHHGRISGRNRDDSVKGSVFAVRIPLDEGLYRPEELLEGDDEQQRSLSLSSRGSSPRGELPTRPAPLSAGKYILFIDDDMEMRDYVAQQLGRYYKVSVACDGAEAMKMIGDKTPDIIISDVRMPVMDGLTLLKRLKADPATIDIPVILLSSKNDIADRMAGWDKGADAYLGKPFNIEELETMVGTLLENRRRMKCKYTGAQETVGKIAAPEMKGNDEHLMERILKEINEHIDDQEFNVETLADGVGVSRTHLHRKMKEMIGMTPSDYIRNIRLKRACELLKRSDIEVTQVAYKIGFTSQSHFSTHFKRYTGYSPSEYRAKMLKEGASGADAAADPKLLANNPE
ncbi:MAG: helix-turn-helix domain-containing protein [Bacteroidales bacterium]|nr:helix-turn-helix domain-containing protein [Bacteroidales bacterium]